MKNETQSEMWKNPNLKKQLRNSPPSPLIIFITHRSHQSSSSSVFIFITHYPGHSSSSSLSILVTHHPRHLSSSSVTIIVSHYPHHSSSSSLIILITRFRGTQITLNLLEAARKIVLGDNITSKQIICLKRLLWCLHYNFVELFLFGQRKNVKKNLSDS